MGKLLGNWGWLLLSIQLPQKLYKLTSVWITEQSEAGTVLPSIPSPSFYERCRIGLYYSLNSVSARIQTYRSRGKLASDMPCYRIHDWPLIEILYCRLEQPMIGMLVCTPRSAIKNGNTNSWTRRKYVCTFWLKTRRVHQPHARHHHHHRINWIPLFRVAFVSYAASNGMHPQF